MAKIFLLSLDDFYQRLQPILVLLLFLGSFNSAGHFWKAGASGASWTTIISTTTDTLNK